MSDFTRRSFLGGTGVLPLALWLQLQGCGRGDGPGEPPDVPDEPDVPDVPGASRIRYDATSAEGKKMLELYAKGVKNMMDTSVTPEGDPRSWLFQWYTHAVRGDRTKAGEIARVYPSPSPWRDLANLMWNTCQAHFPGAPEDYFLPWHRMFVYYFEAIVRQACGDDSFTLPYWNYSVPAPSLHGIIPPEFRMQGDPVFGSLFVGKRNAGVNAGNPIDAGSQGNPLGLGSLAQCEYGSSPGVQGFNAALDFGLHGNVHVLTGNGQNMGAVPWAAGDPIFWLHHCNIDRLWASWNAAGRDNPTGAAWVDKTFTFADTDGNQVTAKIGDFTAIAPLDYAYDALEPVPSCPAAIGVQEVPQAVTAAKSSNVALGAAAVRFTLDPVTGDGGGIGVETTEETRLYLVAKGLFTEVQPGVLYNVYLGLPEGASDEQAKDYLIGTLNFFGAGGHGGHMTAATVEEDKFHSFDVTDLAKRLAAEDPSGAPPALTIAPSGTPASEAKPVVAEVSLVQR